jgi:hypothetical protein
MLQVPEVRVQQGLSPFRPTPLQDHIPIDAVPGDPLDFLTGSIIQAEAGTEEEQTLFTAERWTPS